ncbi:MAG: hypothetical protein CL853_03775, partial [Crocinitomicaceae bacterium]|nr:hypothetical protein [Crocinitomicaceae bacterium]
MKPISKFPRILLLLIVCFFMNLFSFKAQNSIVPDKINYQAIAHSSNGQTLNNQTIDVLIGIHSQSSSGTLVYQEEHNVTTNDYGLFTLSIGDGTPLLNPFNSIGWEDQNYYLNVQVDNGFGYEDLGSQQLVTVPYALHARTVEVDNVDDDDNDPANEYNINVTLNGDTLQITDGGGTQSVDLSSISSSDNQNLTGATLSGTNLTIDIEDGNSTSVDLSSLQDGVDDADNDPANEFNTNVSLNGDTLQITDGGGTQSIDLSNLSGSDNQNLTGATLSGTNLTIDIENGNSTSVDLSTLQDGVDDADNNPTNELQTLSLLSGNTLYLSVSGDSVVLPSISFIAGAGIDINSGIISNTGDGDNDPNNELISNAALSPSNDFLIIDEGSGNFTSIDVSDLNNSGTDNQDLIGASLSGTNLTIDIENGSSTTVDLSSLQDGVGTDDQNLTGATLSGNNLTIGIESGSSATVD